MYTEHILSTMLLRCVDLPQNNLQRSREHSWWFCASCLLEELTPMFWTRTPGHHCCGQPRLGQQTPSWLWLTSEPPVTQWTMMVSQPSTAQPREVTESVSASWSRCVELMWTWEMVMAAPRSSTPSLWGLLTARSCCWSVELTLISRTGKAALQLTVELLKEWIEDIGSLQFSTWN